MVTTFLVEVVQALLEKQTNKQQKDYLIALPTNLFFIHAADAEPLKWLTMLLSNYEALKQKPTGK